MKFICDQMLAEVGRWLRAAGYDTRIVEERLGDKEILDCAILERRHLLTRDRHFLSMDAPAKTVIYLRGNSTGECIREINREFGINWLHAPFSRCLVCNTLFVRPSAEQILELVPESIRQTMDEFWGCPECQKIYWRGSHTRQMLRQLQDWQASC